MRGPCGGAGRRTGSGEVEKGKRGWGSSEEEGEKKHKAAAKKTKERKKGLGEVVLCRGCWRVGASGGG